jgi:hypothetical protein
MVAHESRWRLMRHNVSALPLPEGRLQEVPGTDAALHAVHAPARGVAAAGEGATEDADAVL